MGRSRGDGSAGVWAVARAKVPAKGPFIVASRPGRRGRRRRGPREGIGQEDCFLLATDQAARRGASRGRSGVLRRREGRTGAGSVFCTAANPKPAPTNPI